ncbi:MAG: AAA family ATPase, partial [Nitriliruptoraceae bacterium]|nr:AAA family ATPase [Nitriliruptoraceae bacterium]
MDALEVSCFGGFQLRSGDHAVPPMPSRAARSLFAYLAVDRGVAHPRERLAARFWPDLPESRARRRLSHTLWQVQDALGEIGDASTWLEVTPDTLAVSADAPCEVDVERFEAGLDRARSRHQHGEDRVRDLSELGAIVELYRGEFLAGHTEPWVLDEQERLHLRYVEALGLLVGMAKRHGSYADALVYARRLTNEDPLREDAHREVMRLSVLQGRVEDALRQFERCREVLADELGTEPSAATQALRDRIARRRERIEPAPAPTTSTAERTPLLGRERERDRGVTLLERTLAGHGGVLFVEAEPGGGTSRLLAELADDADWRGVAVARTELVPAGHLSAFGAVRELAAQLLTPLRLEQLRPRLAPVWLHELAPMVPTLARLQAEPPSPAAGLQAAERAQRLQDAFTHVLLANADLQPLVLVIDGIQWADAESLDVLTALAGQLDGHGVLLAIGYRAEEARADDDVWTALRAIDQRAHPERLRLAPLDAFTVGELVRTLVRGQAVAPEAVTRLHRETGGNPLFLVETVRALAEDDALSWLDPRDDTPLPLPSTIRELVEARLARLAPAERAVLDLAAIADGEVEVGVLAVASELPDEQVMDAAELLVRRQLLVQSSTAIGVRHEQVRRAVVDALDGARAEVIHGRLARALEERGSDQPERLARHFIAAGLVGRAREYLVRAARAAVATHAYATAERAYRQAIQTSAGPQRLDDRIGLLLEHEAVLDVLGEREWQGRVLEELIGLSGSDPRRRSDVLRRRALWHGHRGALDRALEDADRAVGSAEQHLTATTAGAGADHASDAEILARALVARASVLTWASRPTDAVEELERVGRVAPGSAEAIQAQVQLGSVLRELQRYEESRATLESVLAVTVARGNAREETIALGVLGTVEMETGHSDAAIQLYGRAIERAAAIGYRRPQAIHLLNRGVALVTRGHYGPALADLGEAGVVFDAAQDLRGSAVVAVNRAYLRHIVVGDDELARTELEPALHYLRAHDDVAFAATALDTLAGIALRAGELARARDLLEEAVGLVAEPAAGRVRPQVLRRRAELELQAGTPETALDTARQATATATELGMRDEVPAGRVLEAAARLAVDDAPGARTIAMAAVDGLGPGIERAYLVRLVAAEVLEACGDRQEARAMAEQAREEVATALATLEPEEAARGAQLPELVRLDDLVRRLAPVRRLVTVAHRDAPPGRPPAGPPRGAGGGGRPPGPPAPPRGGRGGPR